MDYSAKCRLIRLIEEEEPIWNTGSDDYSRLDKKNASWNRVHKEMLECGFNGGMLELKTTWKNLRDQWRKNTLNKMAGNSSKQWTFEKHLLFLATAQTEVMNADLKREFIRLIREEEMLWNTECRDYYRLDKKNLAWSRILTGLERKGFRGGLLDLKATWKSLRDTKRRNSQLPSSSGKPWIFEKDMEFLDGRNDSVQFSPHVENDSKVNSLVDSPRSSATPEEMADESAEADDGNDTYFVPVSEMGGDKSPENGSEPSRKRSYGGGFNSKKKKMDSLQEGLDMIREITASLRQRLSAATMDKYDRYGAFIASSLREMPEAASQRKMAQLMDCLLNQGNRT
ncbi:hypothetical protein V3C99_003799 [Haemonchus contortus]